MPSYHEEEEAEGKDDKEKRKSERDRDVDRHRHTVEEYSESKRKMISMEASREISHFSLHLTMKPCQTSACRIGTHVAI